MFSRKGRAVKTIKVLRIQEKADPVIDPSQGEHMLGLSLQVEFLYNVNL